MLEDALLRVAQGTRTPGSAEAAHALLLQLRSEALPHFAAEEAALSSDWLRAHGTLGEVAELYMRVTALSPLLAVYNPREWNS